MNFCFKDNSYSLTEYHKISLLFPTMVTFYYLGLSQVSEQTFLILGRQREEQNPAVAELCYDIRHSQPLQEYCALWSLWFTGRIMQDSQHFIIHLPISSSGFGFQVLLGTKPGQTMEVGHTGHGLFGSWHDIVTTDITSQTPFTLEMRVQMDSYIEVVLQVLRPPHERRYLPKAWGYSEEPQSIRKRQTTKMLHIKLSQPSSLESDMTLIVFASLDHFRQLKTLFLLFTFSKFYRQMSSCWELRGLPDLQEMLCLKSSCLAEVSSHAGDSSVKHPLELPSPTEDKGSCHMPMHEQFLTHSQKHPKESVCRIFCHMEELWFGLFPSCISLSKKERKKGELCFLLCKSRPRIHLPLRDSSLLVPGKPRQSRKRL